MTRPKPREPVNRDLFGGQALDDPDAKVERLLQVVQTSEKAWFLRGLDRKARAAWIPKARAERGVGPNQNVFTMTRADARERGWL